MNQEIEEIKSKIDIIDLMSEYIKLIPAGANNYKALCPFHNEKTPSFMVNRDKQIYKCFGCGEGGDVFNFIMKIEGLDFREALKILAQKAGVHLSSLSHSVDANNQKNKLYSITDLAMKYWHKVLIESSQAEVVRGYLKNRGISQESIEDFKLGYAVDAWDDLYKFLMKRGFTENEIFLAGLLVKKDRGSGFYDRFRDRLIFPIFDSLSRVVGFGGRALKDSDMAKYINTPQSNIYDKSKVLYGINFAKDEIRKKDVCILVEGYMDVLPSHQAGIKNVVSISGTALTTEQIKLIKRYSNNLALSLDMDNAGKQAAIRSIDLGLENELNIKVITLPQGKDPGECIQNSVDDWISAIASAQSVMDYFFDQANDIYDATKPEEKKMAVKFLLEKIIKIGSKVEQDYWLKKLANDLSVSESILREIIPNNKQKVIVKSVSSIKNVTQDYRDIRIVKRILAILLVYPQYFSEVLNNLDIRYLENDNTITIYKKMVLFYTINTDLVDNLAGDNSNSDFFNLLIKWLKENNFEQDLGLINEIYLLGQKDFLNLNEREIRQEIDGLVKALKDDYLNKRIGDLKSKLSELENSGANRKDVDSIYQELSEVIKEKKY